MNNLQFFWRIEGDPLRSDPCDSVDQIARGQRGEIWLPDGTRVPAEITNWVLRTHPLDSEKINIFCMYALRPDAGTFPVDERNFKFGTHALLITRPQEFIDKMGPHLRREGVQRGAGLVEYVSDDHTGGIGPFRKLKRFAYQSEWRVVCYNGPGKARIIRIGSIEDMSIMMPSAQINNHNWFRSEPNEPKEPTKRTKEPDTHTQ